MPHYYPMMDGCYAGGHPFFGMGMALIWLIFLIVVAYLVYKLIKSGKILAPKEPSIRSAADILDERYAKGELTKEQYMQMKEDLKGAK
jgi:putative membrane protein